MRKALSASLVLGMALAMVGCGYTTPVVSQTVSGRPDVVLDTFKTPDNYSRVTLFCRNGDYYVYMDGNRSGSVQQIPADPRCVGK